MDKKYSIDLKTAHNGYVFVRKIGPGVAQKSIKYEFSPEDTAQLKELREKMNAVHPPLRPKPANYNQLMTQRREYYAQMEQIAIKYVKEEDFYGL